MCIFLSSLPYFITSAFYVIICNLCHNITIGRDTFSVVQFSWNVFIVLLILKLCIFDDIILVSLFDIILFYFTQYNKILVQLHMYYLYSIRPVFFYSTISIPYILMFYFMDKSRCISFVY